MDLNTSILFVIYFFIYAIVGWVCEVIYCAIIDRQWENRGFLYGPYCPIYGFGALLVLQFLIPIQTHPILLFFAAIIVCTVLEYITSWGMEKVFHMRLWDYSQMKFNLNGRVCLLNSVFFGVLGLLLVYIVHPLVMAWVGKIEHTTYFVLTIFIILSMVLDFVISAKSLFSAAQQLAELRVYYEKFKAAQAHTRKKVKDNIKETIARLRTQKRHNQQTHDTKLLLNTLEKMDLSNRKLQQMLNSPPGSMELHELGLALQILHAYLEKQALEDPPLAVPSQQDPPKDTQPSTPPSNLPTP